MAQRTPKQTWLALLAPVQRHFRRERARRILALVPGIVGARVVDVGGEPRFWEAVIDLLRPGSVLMLNLAPPDADERAAIARLCAAGWRVQARVYDGRALPEAARGEAVLLCHSVIEHVPLGARPAFARELAQACPRFVVQVPAPAFPLEMHFLLPFLHWLPRPLGRKLVRLSPFALVTGGTGQRMFDQTRLLGRGELAALFPGCAIATERFCLIPKSYLAIGSGEAAEVTR